MAHLVRISCTRALRKSHAAPCQGFRVSFANDATNHLRVVRRHPCSCHRTPPSTRPAMPACPRRTGLVVCTSAPACDVGAAILAKGGNAVDAAVATAFALAVTHPRRRQHRRRRLHGRPHSANGDATTFDYREKAPLQVHAHDVHRATASVDISLTNQGYLAPGVPGTVRGLAMAHKKFGRAAMEGRSSCRRSQLAEEGFVLSDGLARSLNSQLAGTMAKVPGFGCGVRQTGRRQWQAGDRTRPQGPGEDAARDRDRRARRLLQGLDR